VATTHRHTHRHRHTQTCDFITFAGRLPPPYPPVRWLTVFFLSPLFVFLLIFASISLLFLGNLSRYCYIPVHHARTSFSTPAKTNKQTNKQTSKVPTRSRKEVATIHETNKQKKRTRQTHLFSLISGDEEFDGSYTNTDQLIFTPIWEEAALSSIAVDDFINGRHNLVSCRL